MLEKHILITASNKTGIVEFAEAVDNAGMGVVATQVTGEYLSENCSVPIVSGYDFLLSDEHTLRPYERAMLKGSAKAVEASSDKEDRSRKQDRLNANIGHLLARSLSEHPAYLKEDNLPVLHGAYDNPAPAAPEESSQGSHHFLASDIIGLHVIYSAIDGHRFIGTRHEYLESYTALLQANPRALEQEDVIQKSIKEALSYLTVFNTRAASRQHWIETPVFPPAELPKD